MDPDSWKDTEKLSDSDNTFLTRQFSEEQIRETLFAMDAKRAPGPDNIRVEFYQCCWDVVKFDIMRLFDEFHKGTLDVQRRVITLLHKVSDAERIQQFRPICLLRIQYKLLIKSFNRRVACFANKLINRAQNAFIKGRNIMDGILSYTSSSTIPMLRRKLG